LSQPEWVGGPPNLFDIVTGYYPESKPKAGTPAHRPCLITAVYRNEETGQHACEIAYGTKSLKQHNRQGLDVIVVNSADLDAMGLPMATRFNLDADKRVTLLWASENFQPWTGYSTPKIGALLLEYQKEYAWLMATRAGT
jgi:hypothetical protein